MGTASKKLVIDADVAQAAGGEDATSAVSKRCRDFLRDVLEICHHMVLVPELGSEWKEHASTRARAWRREMEGRKKVCRKPAMLRQELLDKILASGAPHAWQKVAAAEDFHLILAALEGDMRVVSLDEQARKIFASAARTVHEIRSIVWVNPSREEEDAQQWLSAGAPPEAARQLGNWGIRAHHA